MENNTLGILTFLVVIAVYTIACRMYKKEQYSSALYLIMLGGLVLRIFTALDFHLHPWDERYHALVAKNLLDNPFKPMLYKVPLLDHDFKNWSNNHIWVHKQPFPLYSMAASMWLFGKNEIALRIPSLILCTLAIFTTFKIGKILFTTRVGLLAAFLFSINGLIIEQTAGRVATDHIDVFFFSLITIASYFLINSVNKSSRLSFIVGAIITGLAILSKWLPALIVLPLWLLYALNRLPWREIIAQIFIFIGVVVLIVLPWQLYILHYFPREAAWEYAYNKKHFFEALGPHGQPFYYHFAKMRIIFGELIYLPMIWLIIMAFKDFKQHSYSKIILTTWILVPYLFFSFAVTKMQGYILLCAAPIFITTALFFFYLKAMSTRFPQLRNLVLVLLIFLPIRYSIERIKPFSKLERNPDWVSTLKQLDLNQHTNKIVIFNCKYPIETMFYTDFIAYETMPDTDKLKEIHANGYDIWVDNNGEVKDEWYALDFLKFVAISQSNK